MNYSKFIVYRLTLMIFTLWVVLTMLFVFFRFMLPGSFIDVLLVQGADPATIAATKEKWGLNDPIYVQYWRYLTNFLTLDAGTSLEYRIPVWEHVRMKIFNSFILVAPGITVAYLLGSVIGLGLGAKRGTWIEKHGLVPILTMGAFPEFFVAILLIAVFAGWLGWFPTGGMVAIGEYSQDAAWWRVYFTESFLFHYTLPFTAVLMRYLNLPTLIMRTSVVETLGDDFYNYHKISGIKKLKRMKQLARHSILPVITLYPVSMTRAIGGLILIEIVFNWPGIGAALVRAITIRDVPVVQFIFFLTAAFVIFGNFFIDILYTVIDPRIDVER